MGGYDLGSFIKVGVDILTSTVNKVTGKILLQVGDVREQTTDASNVESWQHVCWASRPSAPDAGKKSAQALTLSAGDRDICIASQDVRCLEQYGNLDFGEFCAFAPGLDGAAQGRVIGKNDGSVTLFTTDDNTKAGHSVFLRLAPDGLLFVAPWGAMRFDASGFHVRHASGASIDLGAIGGLPPPLDVISSYLKLQASTVSASSVGAPIADATSVMATIAALQTQLTAVAAGFAKLALVSGTVMGTDAVAAAGLVTPIIAAGAAAVGVQTPLIPKGSGMT